MDQAGEPRPAFWRLLTRPLPALLRRREPWCAVSLCAACCMFAYAVLAVADGRGGARAVARPMPGPIAYHLLPDLVADLKSSRSRPHYVQLSTVVELPQEALESLREKEVEIVAAIQARLRDLYKTDLIGSAGVERLRSDVQTVVNAHIAPTRVRAVLFTRFLVD